MTSHVDLTDVQKKASYIWELRGYSSYADQTYATSPIFSPTNDENIKFFLRFTGRYLHSTDFSNNLFYTISLCLKNPIQKELQVFYRLAIVDINGQKRFPHGGLSLFYINSSTEIFGYHEARHGWEYKISNVYMKASQKLVQDNNIKFSCEVFVLENPNVQIIESDQHDIPKNQVLADYGALLKSGDHSDVVLVVGKKEFNLHKIILAARSPVFSAMFNCDLEEKKQNRVTITDMDVEVAELILPYIYTGEIPSMKEYALELFFVSDKYQLEHLKAICEKTLMKTLSVETVAKTLLLADMHSATSLKNKSIEFITQNSEQVKNTKGWSEMLKNRPELLIELYNDISVKASPLLKN